MNIESAFANHVVKTDSLEEVLQAARAGRDLFLRFYPAPIVFELDNLPCIAIQGDQFNACIHPSQAISAYTTFLNNKNTYQYFVNVYWEKDWGVSRSNIRFPTRSGIMRHDIQNDFVERDKQLDWFYLKQDWVPVEPRQIFEYPLPFKIKCQVGDTTFIVPAVNSCIWNTGNQTVRLPPVSMYDRSTNTLRLYDIYAYIGKLVSLRVEVWGPRGVQKIECEDLAGETQILVPDI